MFKKIISIFFILLLLTSCIGLQKIDEDIMAATESGSAKIRGCDHLTDGLAGALDRFDGNDLNDNDIVFCVDSNDVFYPYRLEDYPSAPPSENPPYVITPDTNPGNKRWLLISIRSGPGEGLDEGGLYLFEDPTNGNNFIGWKAPATLSDDLLFEMDDTSPSNSILYFGTPAGGVSQADFTKVRNLIDSDLASAPMWQAIALSPSALIADGTNCTDPASEQINGGPIVWFITCSDNPGTMQVGIPMPENWNGGDLYIKLVAGSNQGSPAGTVEFEGQVMPRGDDDLINNTWANAKTIQFGSNIDTQYDPVMAESSLFTSVGGAGGDMLFVRLTRDNDDGTNDTSTQEVEIWGATIFYQADDTDERD